MPPLGSFPSASPICLDSALFLWACVSSFLPLLPHAKPSPPMSTIVATHPKTTRCVSTAPQPSRRYALHLQPSLDPSSIPHPHLRIPFLLSDFPKQCTPSSVINNTFHTPISVPSSTGPDGLRHPGNEAFLHFIMTVLYISLKPISRPTRNDDACMHTYLLSSPSSCGPVYWTGCRLPNPVVPSLGIPDLAMCARPSRREVHEFLARHRDATPTASPLLLALTSLTPH